MEIKLPFLGDNIPQGTVTKILVKAGDAITKDQNILELETDKAVMEVPSPSAGIIGEILVKAGAVIKVGQPIFTLAGSAEASPVAKPTVAPVIPAKPTPSATPVVATPTQVNASGAIVDYNLQALGENILKGTITKILVKANDSVKKGQGILEIETDKAVLEVPSSADFIVKEVIVKTGAVINVGAPVFKVQLGAAAVAAKSDLAKQSPTNVTTTQAALSAQAPAKAFRDDKNTALPVRANIPAAPSVRLFAREIGIDIAQVPGSGPGGRLSIDDVKKFAKALNTSRPQGGSTISAQPLPDFSKWGSTRRDPMSNVRKKTAEHLSYAWNSIPHVTQFEKADITELEKLRKSISVPEKKISITPFLIKIIAQALKKFPQFNSSVDMTTHEIVLKEYVNIGVAVDTDRGLIVPVLKNVDSLSVMQIHDNLTAIAERARARKTTMDELQGGCFTISNLGGIGGTFFTPIVNTPEVAILGVSRGVLEPVYTDGQFTPRLMLPLSLSYDHRVIDGADGARFIRFIAESIQQPDLIK